MAAAYTLVGYTCNSLEIIQLNQLFKIIQKTNSMCRMRDKDARHDGAYAATHFGPCKKKAPRLGRFDFERDWFSRQ